MSRGWNWRGGVIAAVLPGLLVMGCSSSDDDGNGGTPRPTATRPNDTPTPVPTATVAGGTPVATATQVSGTPLPTATQAAGQAPAEVQAFISSIVGSFAGLANVANPGGGAGAQINPFPITTNCQGGGQVTVDCGASGAGILFALDFNNCAQNNNGVAALLDGSADINSTGVCLGNPLPNGSPFTLAFDGTIETSDAGGAFDADVDIVMNAVLEASGAVRLTLDGSAEASCFSDTVTIATPEEIVIPANADCPSAGVIDATFGGEAHEIAYTGTGGVEIDLGTDGSVDDSYPSCIDETLARCGS